MTCVKTKVAIAAIALYTAACGGTQSASPPSPSPTSDQSSAVLTFTLTPEPGVTASGTVLVTPAPASTTMELKITGLQASSSHVSHIHLGSCQQRGGIAFALSQLVADGQGDADTKTSLPQKFPPATGHWYAVVHAGPDMQGSNAGYLLCGNLFQ